MSAPPGKTSARSVLDKFQALESQVQLLQPALLTYDFGHGVSYGIPWSFVCSGGSMKQR